MCVHENVCVDCYHGSLSKRSNRASRSVMSTFGSAVPLTVERSNSSGLPVVWRGASLARNDSSTIAVSVVPLVRRTRDLGVLRKHVAVCERDGPAGTIGRELLEPTSLLFESWHGFALDRAVWLGAGAAETMPAAWRAE